MTDVSWKDRYEHLKRRNANEAEKQGDMLAMGIDSALVHAGAGLFGFLHGRKGGMPAVARVPLDAIVSTVGQGLGFVMMMTGRPWGRHIVAAALGPSAVWTAGLAAKWGQKIRREKGDMLSPEGGNVAMTKKQEEELGVQYRPPVVAGGTRVPSNTLGVYA